MHAGRFDVIDGVLTEVSRGTEAAMVYLLCGTFRVRDRLAHWDVAVTVARRELGRRGRDADAVLLGLVWPKDASPAPAC